MKLSETITGKRIILQRPQPLMTQAKIIFAHISISRANMLPWLDWVDKVKTAQDRLKFLQYVDECWEQDKEFSYNILIRADQSYAGHVSVVNIDTMKMSAEFGYWLSDMAVGNGYMQEALCLLETELKNRGFKELIIEIDKCNLRSLNVAKNLNYILDKSRNRQQASTVSNQVREIEFHVKEL